MIIHMPLKTQAYDILIGHQTTIKLLKVLEDNKQKNVYILTDNNLFFLYEKKLLSLLKNYQVFFTIVEPGESSKSLIMYEFVLDNLIEQGIKRDDVLIAFGGGIVGDLGGFVSASLYRGISYVQIPTSLLAMVDSSIGGKTGINTKHGKNLIGAFHQPIKVIIDLEYLKTLPNHEYKNGMAEIIKAGFIGDEILIDKLYKQEIQTKEMIIRAIEVKKNVVVKDPFDHKERMFLNFGHTFGHAFENITNYTVSHGFAVAEGIIISLRIGVKLNITNRSVLKLAHNILEKYDLGLLKPNPNTMIEQTMMDKKNIRGVLNMILLEDVSKPIIYAISKEELYGCFNSKTTV